jgi:hypothetical protein
MSAVETSDHVSSEHFLGTSLALDSVGAQLAELCPACAGGTVGKSRGEGASAAPFVAVLVGSSEVRNRHRKQTMCPSLLLTLFLSFRDACTGMRARQNSTARRLESGLK